MEADERESAWPRERGVEEEDSLVSHERGYWPGRGCGELEAMSLVEAEHRQEVMELEAAEGSSTDLAETGQQLVALVGSSTDLA